MVKDYKWHHKERKWEIKPYHQERRGHALYKIRCSENKIIPKLQKDSHMKDKGPVILTNAYSFLMQCCSIELHQRKCIDRESLD